MCIAGFGAIAVAQEEEREFVGGKWVKPADPTQTGPAGDLARIRLKIQNQEGSAALSLAKAFLKNYPDEPGREEAIYLAGQAEMIRGMYYQAFEWFKRQWDEYPSGALSEKALQKEYEIANAFLAGKKRVFAGIFHLPARSEGQEILARIAEQAPGSTIAEMALLCVVEDHVAHREYADAAVAYDRCLELFPKSGKAKDVTLQAARATLASYKGTQFDPTPLIEARQRFSQFQKDYPQSAQKAGVSETLQHIERKRAADDFAAAQLYERTGHKQAAAFYYRIVRDTYPDTDLAPKAKAALTRLGDVNPPKTPAGIVSTRPAPTTQPTTEPAGATTEPTSMPTTAPEPTTRKFGNIEPLDLENLVPGALSRPASQPTSKPVTQPSSTEPTSQDAATEPTTEPATEPTTMPATEPTTEPATAPASSEPTTQASSEPTSTQSTEISELSTQPTTNPTIIEPADEPSTKPSSEPAIEATE